MARHRLSSMIRFLLVGCIGAILPAAAVGQTIVWTDQNARKIQKKDVSGGPVQTIVQFPSSPAAGQIHYDSVAAKVYYTRGIGLQRANLDGSDPEDIPISRTGKFTLNVDSRKLYWISGSSLNVLNRSELDGTGIESHTYPSCCVLALEAFADDAFFGGGGTLAKGIWRADADGSNEQFLHSTGQPTDLAHDPVDNKLYIAASNAVSRMNLDGTEFQSLVELPAWQSGDSAPTQVVVDSWNRKLYWADHDAKVIQQSNLDGSNVENFVTAGNAGNPNFDIAGLTIVGPAPIPTLSTWGLLALGGLLLGAGVLLLRNRLAWRFSGRAKRWIQSSIGVAWL